MPRTSSRKRNSRRIDSTVRVTSNLSPNAPEFIPIANDETTANQQRETVIRSVTFCASSSASNSSGNNSNSNYEASTIVSSIPDALKNKGQRDLLINLLNECRVDCVICYERAKNVEQIWNCRNCYQIMHLKCIIVWFIKSHRNAVWRCPACQSEVTGKPKYVCFCGTLPNPFHNNVDIPHSCGQVCGLQRKNSNLNYNDCHHKCTLLCHPGPCPQCVVQVLRSCGCGKKRVYAQCGQSTQIVCDNVCLKKLNCQIHACEKICHANSCEPCNKGCPQNLNPSEENLAIANARFADAILQYNLLPPESLVTEEELRMLGLNPEELFDQRNVPNSYYSTFHENGDANNIARNNEEFYLIESDTDDDVVEDNMDDIMNTIHFGMNSNTFFLQHERPRYIGSDEIFENYPITDDSHDDVEEIEDDDDGGVGGGDISSSDNGEYSGCDSNNRSLTNSSNEDHEEIEIEISSPASNPSDRSWDMSESELVNPNSSYSEDSTDSSSDSDDSSSNNANSSTSTTSSSSSSSTSSSSRSSSRSSSSSSSSSSF